MEKKQSGHEKKMSRRSITSYSKYNNNKQNVVIFYKKWKKYNEIQLTKNKIDLNFRKNDKSSTLPPTKNPKHKPNASPRKRTEVTTLQVHETNNILPITN